MKAILDRHEQENKNMFLVALQRVHPGTRAAGTRHNIVKMEHSATEPAPDLRDAAAALE